ncbi:kynurenine--oxoglutarate transaminase 3-like isoform X1 [Mizuhopecten yessoensis]|uniref:kynurenine--oxoglutarate transaminase 3-like isoform X1 n=2 Tax=Mizuhopecten yessoensis TaxID=6573 RepID=UPI000B45C6F1|nr:kynurenine--oxoglutarate transaminase 3-like isoform X1 [Mizuhopecten yessoensis]XP_021370121.1 kynurenine--oxoglutarate transaminase 3-like isoform X1 [Mizuhopecten yessoensis]
MQSCLAGVGRNLCLACRQFKPVNQTLSRLQPYVCILATQHRNMASSKLGMANRLKGTEKNIWVEFGKLAGEHKALNLGQGFPDFKPPQHVIDEIVKAVNSDNALLAQYARSYGHPRLVNVLSKLYGPLMKHEINPMTDITVCVGAYGVLFCAVQGLVNPGDEVIIVEPYFDCYEPMAMVAGATPVFVPIRPTKTGVMSSADWKLDPQELASKFSSKTKAIIINNPNNPIGKVFKEDELQMIADLCIKHDAICIADEVYEWLTYDNSKHVKIASLPGMWDRTVTIGSGGKTFSATGWKLGWAIGPQSLIQPMQILHQNCIYTSPTPIQEAVAAGLEYELDLKIKNKLEDCYLYSLAKETQPKRDKLAAMLQDIGMDVTMPEGGYFLMADISKIKNKIQLTDDGSSDPYDYKFVRWMTATKKLAAIPPSAFYSKGHKNLGENFLRFCFIKDNETLRKAEVIFKEWKESL